MIETIYRARCDAPRCSEAGPVKSHVDEAAHAASLEGWSGRELIEDGPIMMFCPRHARALQEADEQG